MGRTKGSKNKSNLKDEALEIKKEDALLVNDKDIKREIRKLRKIKLQCRAGSKERIELEHNIKTLKRHLAERDTPEPEKDKLIAEILERDKVMASIDIDLKKHSVENLQRYLNKLKGEKK